MSGLAASNVTPAHLLTQVPGSSQASPQEAQASEGTGTMSRDSGPRGQGTGADG
jgi:hypothetical protein